LTIFTEWLKEQGAYDEYMKFINTGAIREAEAIDYIASAFTWGNSSSGHNFWETLNYEWQDICRATSIDEIVFSSEKKKEGTSLKGSYILSREEIDGILGNKESSENNGGSTDYYKFDPEWKDCQDIIEDRNMNYAQGNIFKSAFTFNIGRHSGTDYERDLNKIIWFAQRELERIKNDHN